MCEKRSSESLGLADMCSHQGPSAAFWRKAWWGLCRQELDKNWDRGVYLEEETEKTFLESNESLRNLMAEA